MVCAWGFAHREVISEKHYQLYLEQSTFLGTKDRSQLNYIWSNTDTNGFLFPLKSLIISSYNQVLCSLWTQRTKNLIKLGNVVVLFRKVQKILMKNKKIVYRTHLTDGLSAKGIWIGPLTCHIFDNNSSFDIVAEAARNFVSNGGLSLCGVNGYVLAPKSALFVLHRFTTFEGSQFYAVTLILVAQNHVESLILIWKNCAT